MKAHLTPFLSVAILLFGLLDPAWPGSTPPDDPVSTRVIAFFREHGHQIDPPTNDPAAPYWKELKWYQEQGEAARPALMFLLTDEYSDQFGKMSDVLSALLNAPGDQTEVLRFTRQELNSIPEDCKDGLPSFINVSLRALAKLGDEGDLDLIARFKNYPDPTVRSSAFRQHQNLEKKLSDVTNPPSPGPQPHDQGPKPEGETASKEPKSSLTAASASDRELNASNWKILIIFAALGVIVLGLIAFARRRRA